MPTKKTPGGAYGPAVAMWRAMPRNILDDLARVVREAADRRAGAGPAVLFFRADDIGAPGQTFGRMAGLFRSHGVALGLAVVPAWLTAARRDCLLDMLGPDGELFCLHQHGWRHADHEAALAGNPSPGRAGRRSRKKCEFGPARSFHHKLADLRRGRDKLAGLLGGRVSPIFTPPWNRLDAETLEGLGRLGFRAVSRSLGALPPIPEPLSGLVSLDVTVDLHTRKEPDPEAAFSGLLAELGDSLERGWCGVMLHHGRMDGGAFDFLDGLLELCRTVPGIETRSMDSLLPPLPPAA
jgi:hypothetical protein